MILLVVPLFTTNIVRSFGWMVLLGRNGLVNDALIAPGLIDRPMRFLGTELGILIGLVYILLPFVVLAVGNALAKIDPAFPPPPPPPPSRPRPISARRRRAPSGSSPCCWACPAPWPAPSWSSRWRSAPM